MALDFGPVLYAAFTVIYIPIFITLMRKKRAIEYHILFLGFYIYCLLVIKEVFLPIPLDNITVKILQQVNKGPMFNVVPLKSIIDAIKYHVSLTQIAYNICLFGPLGFLLPFINRKVDSTKKILILSLVVSTSIELIQLSVSLAINAVYRFADIDDIITNVIGALIGYMIYKIVNKPLKKLVDYDSWK